MGDPGNPTDDGTERDPEQPGWASPTPPPPAASPPPPVDPTQPAAAPPPPPAATQPTTPAWGAPPPEAPGPPGGAATWAPPPGPPPKKRRLTWLWILIPLMFVLVAATVVTVIFGVKLFIGPIDATDDYYANIRD